MYGLSEDIDLRFLRPNDHRLGFWKVICVEVRYQLPRMSFIIQMARLNPADRRLSLGRTFTAEILESLVDYSGDLLGEVVGGA